MVQRSAACTSTSTSTTTIPAGGWLPPSDGSRRSTVIVTLARADTANATDSRIAFSLRMVALLIARAAERRQQQAKIGHIHAAVAVDIGARHIQPLVFAGAEGAEQDREIAQAHDRVAVQVARAVGRL